MSMNINSVHVKIYDGQDFIECTVYD